MMTPLSLLLAAAQLTCAAPVPKAKDPAFAVVSVAYTGADGKMLTAPFKPATAVPPLEEPPGKLRAQIAASAARGAIVIHGTGAKGRPEFKAIKILVPRAGGGEETVSIAPKHEDGRWSATIEPGTLRTNDGYRLLFDGGWAKGCAPDVELFIAAPQ